jgi:hypothetical protein
MGGGCGPVEPRGGKAGLERRGSDTHGCHILELHPANTPDEPCTPAARECGARAKARYALDSRDVPERGSLFVRAA